jgi:hypothetical protein
MLNTLTERDFPDAFKNYFKNCGSAGNSADARKGTTSRVMVASGTKVDFRPDGSTSPGNYGQETVTGWRYHTTRMADPNY